MAARDRLVSETPFEGGKILVTTIRYYTGRGYYVSLQPVTREVCTRGEQTFTTDSFGAFTGATELLLESKRFSAKVLAGLVVPPELFAKLNAKVLAIQVERDGSEV